jgi:hypothetical protein
MLGKHHVDIELPKMKVATTKLLEILFVSIPNVKRMNNIHILIVVRLG